MKKKVENGEKLFRNEGHAPKNKKEYEKCKERITENETGKRNKQ